MIFVKLNVSEDRVRHFYEIYIQTDALKNKSYNYQETFQLMKQLTKNMSEVSTILNTFHPIILFTRRHFQSVFGDTEAIARAVLFKLFVTIMCVCCLLKVGVTDNHFQRVERILLHVMRPLAR